MNFKMKLEKIKFDDKKSPFEEGRFTIKGRIIPERIMYFLGPNIFNSKF